MTAERVDRPWGPPGREGSITENRDSKTPNLNSLITGLTGMHAMYAT